MNTIIFSDAHLTLRDPYGLKDFRERALRQVLEAGVKADMIVQAGDDLNQRYFDAELMAWMSNIYTESLGKDIERLFYLLGNHDGSNRKISPFSTFANGCKCYGQGPHIIGSDPVVFGDFLFRGWLSNDCYGFLGLSTDIQYLITHIRIKEWVKDNPERAYPLDEVCNWPFKRIFTGDLHTPKESGNVVSIGTLCPSSFADRDIRASYIIFDEDHNEYKRIDVTDYPIFRIVNIYEDVEYAPDQKYIKGNIIRLKFIGSPKFVQDKIIRQNWLTTIWLLKPHYVEEDFEQTAQEVVVPVSQISIEEEIKHAAVAHQWPEGADNIAINEVIR